MIIGHRDCGRTESICFNNIGPGLGLCGPAGNFAFFSPLAKVVLCIDMLLGRLELYPMLVLLMPSTWRKK